MLFHIDFPILQFICSSPHSTSQLWQQWPPQLAFLPFIWIVSVEQRRNLHACSCLPFSPSIIVRQRHVARHQPLVLYSKFLRSHCLITSPLDHKGQIRIPLCVFCGVTRPRRRRVAPGWLAANRSAGCRSTTNAPYRSSRLRVTFAVHRGSSLLLPSKSSL